MDYNEIIFEKKKALLKEIRHFEPAQVFECGQCFRFEKVCNGYDIIACGKKLNISRQDDTLILSPCTKEDFYGTWQRYFDLERDYNIVCESFSGADERLRIGMEYGSGVRILRQEPFETCICFIISANNNIGRIKGIVERLCRAYGSKIEGGYAFPTPEQLRNVTQEDYFALGCGYRAAYLHKTVAMILDGFELEKLRGMEYHQAREEIMRLPGVGPKVADCILLFSLDFICAFPVDVWVTRAMQAYMGQKATRKSIETYAKEEFGPYAGVAQQYLFFYVRSMERLKSFDKTKKCL